MKSIKCHQCGFVGWADDEHCKKCGVQRGSEMAGDSQWSQPDHGQQQHYAYVQPQHQSYYGGYAPENLKKGMAVASLVFGIIGFFTLGMLGVGSVIGVVLGIVALSRAKHQPQEYGGQGLATAGLVTNILALVIMVPIGVIAAIAIPNLLAARMAANEGGTIKVLRTISSAEATYQATSGNGQYGTMEQLVNEGLLDSEMANGRRYGYRFTIETKPFTRTEPSGFTAVAVPLEYRSTGRRSFFINETGVIRGDDTRGAVATESTKPLNSDDDYPSTSRRTYSSRPSDF